MTLLFFMAKKNNMVTLKKYLPLIYILFTSFQTYCQNNYDKNWMIGYSPLEKNSNINGAKFVFNADSMTIIPIHKTIELGQSSITMSDSLGNLQFYSNGCSINNSNHKTIINGDSIGKGNYEISYCYPIESGVIPLTQMLFSVPNLVKKDIYYLFYLNLTHAYSQGQGFPLAPTLFYYSEIDMSNGSGKMLKKNEVILKDTFARAMLQGVKHKNNKDWWIIMPKSQSNCYFVTKIDYNGNISTTKQCDGLVWKDGDTKGQSIFSPNKKYFARLGSGHGLSIFDFDNENGKIKAKYLIPIADTFYTSGVAFSSNSRYLYAMCNQKLYQFDMKASNIEKSKILIAKLEKSPKSAYKISFGQSMLAPDGKIYIAGEATHDYLHVIHKPNLPGLSCNLEQYSLKLPCYNGYGLPNMPHFKDWQEDTTKITAINEWEEKGIKALVYPNPATTDINLDLFGYINQYKKGIFNLYDMQGNLAASYSLLQNHDEYRFDISNLANGMYFWHLVLDDKVRQTGKVVVMKE